MSIPTPDDDSVTSISGIAVAITLEYIVQVYDNEIVEWQFFHSLIESPYS